MSEIVNEGGVKAQVKKLLTAHGWMWWMPPANGFGKSNVDVNALKAGHFLAVETKYDKRQLTSNQVKYLCDVSKHGGSALVVRETTLNAFAQWLDVQADPQKLREQLDALEVLTAELRSDRQR